MSKKFSIARKYRKRGDRYSAYAENDIQLTSLVKERRRLKRFVSMLLLLVRLSLLVRRIPQ